MSDFDPIQYGAALAGLLDPPAQMPLAGEEPNQAAFAQLDRLDAAALCGGPPQDPAMAQACLAGLWLYHGFLDRSHRLSQSLDTAEGCYWHGMMHRREGDYANAKYWFRQVGEHPIHADLAAFGVKLGIAWAPDRFVDLCQRACSGEADLAPACLALQDREWWQLFDYCHRRAVGRTPV